MSANEDIDGEVAAVPVPARKPARELRGTELEWSTVSMPSDDKEARSHKVKKKCMLCGAVYTGGPFNIRIHLDPNIKPRVIRACAPERELLKEWHREVVAELRARARAAKALADAEEAKRLRREHGSTALAAPPSAFQAVDPATVATAWMKLIVKKALPLDLVDDKLFREAVALTAKCGSKNLLIGNQVRLPHRTHMTQEVLPALDKMLDTEIVAKIKGLADVTGAMLMSDGWTNVAKKPIVNALASLPLGSYFMAARDTEGKTKNADYIARFMIEQIGIFGKERVVAVCMDGACTASFPLIQREVPHVFCYICPAHSLDNFMKNICSDKATVKVKCLTDRTFPWAEPRFAETIECATHVVNFIVRHQKALAQYRAIAAELPKEEVPKGGTELLRACETRFASNVMMLIRFRNVHHILEKLVIDSTYVAWLGKQTPEVRERGAKAKTIIRDDDMTENVGVAIRVMEPVMRLLRLTDGKAGATLSKVYAYLLQLDMYFRGNIEGLTSTEQHKIHELFMARWEYVHVPAMTAAYRLDPEFCRRSFSADEKNEVKTVLRQMSTDDHTYPDLLADLADFEEALSAGTHDLEEAVAFSERAQKMAPYKWANVYLADWPHLQWAARRLLALSCSASGCERSWSVEDWMHSKKRNRLGQTTVERLVRCHTNLLLQDMVADWECLVLPWDVEMVPEEPEE